MNMRRALSVAVTGSLALALLTGIPTAASAATRSTPPPSGVRTVTLMTGDVVRVTDVGGGRLAADVTRPHGAPGGVRSETVGHDLYVIPDEAMPYLAAGVLDRRLFDITGLLAQGYDDQHSDGIPLIVTHTTAAPTPAPAGTTVARELPSIKGTAVKAPKKKARAVWGSLAPTAPMVAPQRTVSF